MRVALLALVTIAVLGGCGAGAGDGEATAGGATTGAGDAVAACDDLRASVLQPVEDPGPDDGRDEDAPPDPEVVAAQEAAEAALQRLVAAGPEALRDDAAVVAATYELGPGDVDDERYADVVAAADRLIAWGAEECEVDGPVWRCLARGTLRLVGEPIGPGGGEGGAPASAPARPEDAVGGADIDPTWERVEVERTDDRVTFAWLDADGLAVSSATAEAGSRGWREDQTTRCDVGARLPTPSAPIGGDDLPPGEATSTTSP